MRGNSCATTLQEAGEPLLRAAVRDGAVPAEVAVEELITLIVGVVLATEHHPDPPAAATRLFRMAVAGVSPDGPCIGGSG